MTKMHSIPCIVKCLNCNECIRAVKLTAFKLCKILNDSLMQTMTYDVHLPIRNAKTIPAMYEFLPKIKPCTFTLVLGALFIKLHIHTLCTSAIQSYLC